MNYRFLAILISLAFSIPLNSCVSRQEPLTENTMTVRGTVEGLRVGTLFLQKVEDSEIVSIDSLMISGNPDFEFIHQIEQPEIFYLYLQKKDGDTLNDVITFFGEPGMIDIQTQLSTFESSAIITGSENQNLLQDFFSYQRRFQNQNLDLLEDYLNAQKSKNLILADSLQQAIDQLLTRRYLFSINYAIQNADKFMAPYIILTHASEVQTHWLDSISNALSNEVRESIYGCELMKFIENRKSKED